MHQRHSLVTLLLWEGISSLLQKHKCLPEKKRIITLHPPPNSCNVLVNSHPLVNILLLHYIYQTERVRANMLPPRHSKSIYLCLRIWDHRSPWLASVIVNGKGASNVIPSTQTTQLVLPFWLPAMDSSGIIRIKICECHYLLRLPFQPIGIQDKPNHSMFCISHVVTGFFLALNIKYYGVLKHWGAVVVVRSSGSGVHRFGF